MLAHRFIVLISFIHIYIPLNPPLSKESAHTHTHRRTEEEKNTTRGIDHPPFPTMETHSSGTAEKIIPPRNLPPPPSLRRSKPTNSTSLTRPR